MKPVGTMDEEFSIIIVFPYLSFMRGHDLSIDGYGEDDSSWIDGIVRSVVVG